MSNRTVRVTLIAQATGYIQGMQAAQKATRETASEAEKLAQKEQAFDTLGKSMVVVGAAITAVGVAALKTGIQYNTLQQTTRAALTTLLGSAEAANAQMDKLDDFARNSPFAKQTFITAQQQMLGFGVAAEDVLPALDAIQNAVAAFGGSNQQITAIAEIMSRIKSEGRLSGDALQRLGYYGIDAAAIIGSEMGKTSVEIRDMASKPGGIPVDQIWNPLVDGLQNKFGGAADNVKQTFEGSIDRVKAAWRDFSSELAAPLVDPNGGGALIDLLNWTADMMRAFQALPTPVKNVISTVTLATGAVLLLGGTALLAIPKIVAMRNTMATLGITAGVVGKSIGILSAAIAGGAAAYGIAALMDNIGRSGREAALGLEALRAEVIDGNLQAAFVGNRASVDDLSGSLKALFDNRWDVAFNRFVGDTVVSAVGLSSNVGDARKSFEAMGDQLADLVRSGNSELAARRFAEMEVQAKELGYTTEQLTAAMPSYAEALKGVTNETRLAEEASRKNVTELYATKNSAIDAGEEIDKLADKIRGFASESLSARDAQRNFEASIDSLTQAVADNGRTLDITTEAGRSNEAAIDDLARKTLDLAGSTFELTGSQSEATAVLATGRAELIKQLEQFGITGQAAEAYADKLGLVPSRISTEMQLLTANAAKAAEKFVNDWSGKRVTMSMFLDTVNGDRSAAAAAARYTGMAARGYANGGDLDSAPGPKGKDSKLFWGAKGEHVLTADEVDRMGGQAAVYRFREALMAGNAQQAATTGGMSARPVMVAPSLAARGGFGSGTTNQTINQYIETADPALAAAFTMQSLNASLAVKR